MERTWHNLVGKDLVITEAYGARSRKLSLSNLFNRPNMQALYIKEGES